MTSSHRRIGRTANVAVSWSIPILPQPSLRFRSYTPVGDRLPFPGNEDVVDPDRLGFALWPPLASTVLELPHQLLLLRVRRDHRLVAALVADHLGILVTERGLTVRMGGPLAGPLVQREARASALEQVRDQMAIDVVPERRPLSGRSAGPSSGPPHGRLGSGAAAVGSTNASRSATNLGFFRAVGGCPPPGHRKRPGSSRSPDRAILSPREIVERERPVACATRPIPP